ncbi:papain family cysteine protease [Ancylostoma duodenale]|uniref:Papain family cysteine protease n=1 Tax=Ancylostoma duodenale TaxID=51022 RepID=A0A0C2CSG5_9BILA|nr:papain family cysteine protease [Ancylostoma duodenale]
MLACLQEDWSRIERIDGHWGQLVRASKESGMAASSMSSCEGGYPLQAWKYWVKHGVVTGSNYTMKAGCKPYPYAPCEHHDNATRYQPCPSDIYPTNKCEHSCQAGYPTSYENDKHFGATAYAVSKKVADIQKEIMTNGPVEVSYNVYEDFEHYTGGIYVVSGAVPRR